MIVTEIEISDSLRETVGVAVGRASMCWVATPGGVFDSRQASEVVDELISAIKTEVVKIVEAALDDQELQHKADMAEMEDYNDK